MVNQDIEKKIELIRNIAQEIAEILKDIPDEHFVQSIRETREER